MDDIVLYRYEDQWYGYGRVKVCEKKFKVLRETSKGYWIIPDYNYVGAGENYKKWVSKTAFKRYAYPNRQQALFNFKYRKFYQIRILERQIEKAKIAYEKVKDFKKISSFSGYQYPEIFIKEDEFGV